MNEQIYCINFFRMLSYKSKEVCKRLKKLVIHKILI